MPGCMPGGKPGGMPGGGNPGGNPGGGGGGILTESVQRDLLAARKDQGGAGDPGESLAPPLVCRVR
jgi:hypothetical protein